VKDRFWRVFARQCRSAARRRARGLEALYRLGRSLSHLIRIVDELKGRGVAFRSLTEAIDTNRSIDAIVETQKNCSAQGQRL
jgi:DNA invertase Pin-like site-specific DNA recombinase